MDIKALTKEQLRNLLENARRLGRDDVAADVLRELTLRGGGKSSDYALLEWNQASVKDALAPFVEVSRGVPNSKRTSYTEAGGMKIGRRRDDPEWMWVDSYTAIKTPKLNTYFVCYVPRPGDMPYFNMVVNGEVERRYGPSELEAALVRWRELATTAQ
jgi:hypothetical protein